jgi:hypothetical protein
MDQFFPVIRGSKGSKILVEIVVKILSKPGYFFRVQIPDPEPVAVYAGKLRWNF